MQDNLAEGEWTQWFETGEKKVTSYFEKNELNGKYTEYFKNGKIKKTGQNSDGYAEGIWEEFRTDGTLAARVHFLRSQAQGRICFDAKEKMEECD